MIALLVGLLLGADAPAPAVDMKGWETKKLSAFGGPAKFSFDGKLKLPPKTQTAVHPMSTGGAVAYLTLPDGIHVLLLERDKSSPTDEKGLDMQESLVTWQATVLFHKKEKTYRALIVEGEGGLDPHVYNWTVAPGFTCGQKPNGNPKLTRAQADTIIAICTSLAK